MNWRAFLFFPAVVVGVGAFWLMTQPSEEVGSVSQAAPAAVAVRAKIIAQVPLDILVTGYGHVKPLRSWDAVSQVEGRIVSLVEGFATGRLFEEGTVLIEIDPRDYEIRVARAEANLASARAQLQELDAQESNIRAQVALERKIESFLQTEFERNVALVERGTLATSKLEQANRELLNQQRKVLDLENQIALIPVQRISADAMIRTRDVELEEAERDLGRTKIAMPFRGRVASVDLSVGEFVRVGAELATVDDISASEVIAAIQPEDLADAVQAIIKMDNAFALLLRDSDAALAALKGLGFEVAVQQTTSGSIQRWPATITRFIGVSDAKTGTLGLVVRIENPLQPNIELRRRPLNTGSFVEVVFEGMTAGDRVSIPRNLVRYDRDNVPFVFVSGADQTLQRRDIVLGRRIQNRIFVEEGLAAGDTLVLSAPQPAILGQSLTLVMEPDA